MTKRGDDGNKTLGNRQRDEQRIERATEGNRDENRMFGEMGKGETRMGEREGKDGEVVMIMAAVVVMPQYATAPGPRLD